MTTLPDVELVAHERTIAIPVPLAPPVARGSVTAALSATRTGDAIHPSLERTLVWERGNSMPPLTLYTRDLAHLPRGGKCWLVVRYAGKVIASGSVRVIA